MMEELIKKAGILIEALPFIQKFAGSTVVIKYGGNAMINNELKNSVMEDITLLKFIGLNPIVVHGGGPDISKALADRNIKSEFINGLRVTDAETIGVAQMVLVGKTNKEIVSLLNCKGGKAVGFCGIDGSFIKCRKHYVETENGTADNHDAFRRRYLCEHLKALSESGLPVTRYYHWCFVDNFEWLEGFTARFGLVHFDTETHKRTIKESGKFYAEMIARHGITEEMAAEAEREEYPHD